MDYLLPRIQLRAYADAARLIIRILVFGHGQRTLDEFLTPSLEFVCLGQLFVANCQQAYHQGIITIPSGVAITNTSLQYQL